MLRKVAVVGVAVAACVVSFGPTAMADDWRYVRSSGERYVLEVECNNGIAFGAWNECDIRTDNGYHLFVR
jgi:hypothetical protein